MRIITFSQEAPIHWYVLYTFHHPANIKDAWGASSCICTISWTSSASDHIADAVTYSIYVLLRRYHVYVSIKMPWGAYSMLACSSLSTGRHHHVCTYLVHCVRIACLSNSRNLAILYTNIGFYYAKYRVQNNCICYNKVKS